MFSTPLLCVQGALWGKPTWGVYWAWDLRLTTVAVMLLSFAGILSLEALPRRPDPARQLVGDGDHPRRRQRPDRLLLGPLVELAPPAAELARDGQLIDGGAPAPQRAWTARLDRRPPDGPFVDCGRSPSSRHGAAAAG